jgi:hypothetical protein
MLTYSFCNLCYLDLWSKNVEHILIKRVEFLGSIKYVSPERLICFEQHGLQCVNKTRQAENFEMSTRTSEGGGSCGAVDIMC